MADPSDIGAAPWPSDSYLNRGWTISTLKDHSDQMEVWRIRFESERDRRYSEVNIEREKALKIKETADLAALGLAREIQTYKDEKANQLREQIAAERGNYASRIDLEAAVREIKAVIQPLQERTALMGGQQSGSRMTMGALATIILCTAAVATLAMTLLERSPLAPTTELPRATIQTH